MKKLLQKILPILITTPILVISPLLMSSTTAIPASITIDNVLYNIINKGGGTLWISKFHN